MSVTDDSAQAGSDSFWEIGRYMNTVKRTDNGFQLCKDLKRLIEERSEIEKKYSSLLSEWAKKWNNFLDKGVEYGTTRGAWKGLLTEAEHVADLHTKMGENLMSQAHASIKAWQKENYHKSMMHFKETKEFEDGFRKAQKPWGKRLSKVLTTKKEYHSACRTEKSTANQENNARGDSTVSQDQLKKLQDKLRKCQTEVESTREKYAAAVNDLNGYNAKYMEDMTEVYMRCQDFEQKRIDFFKKTLYQIHGCLDLSVEPRYSQIYTNLHATIGNMDPSKDLKWWSANNGVDMAMNWPAFEEYSPELQSIAKRGKLNIGSSDGGIMITGIRHQRDDSYGSYTNDMQPAPDQQPAPTQTYSSQVLNNSASGSGIDSGGTIQDDCESPDYDRTLNPFGEDEEEPPEQDKEMRMERNLQETSTSREPRIHQRDVNNPSPEPEGENPFGDTDGDEAEPEGEEPPSTGWAVRALYDYVKAEEDELEFKAGDIFTQIATEDEMGWCKGMKGGKVGFYPKNYVQRI